MKKSIAVFDFDGTLTTQDTVNAFIVFTYGQVKFYLFVITHAFLFFLYVLRIIGNREIKERMLSHFFLGKPKAEFDRLAHTFARTVLPTLIRTNALNALKEHQRKGHIIVVASASPAEWITVWAKTYGVTKVLASTVEVKSGMMTGKFAINCYGKIKAEMFIKAYPKHKTYAVFVYGDSTGDKELLALADHPKYRTF